MNPFSKTRLKSLLSMLLLVPFLGTMSVLSSCGEDEPGPSEQEIYVFSAATFAQSAEFTQGGQDISFNSGDQAETFFLSLAYANQPACASPADQSLELRPRGRVFLVCLSDPANPTQQGSWALNSGNTTLTFTIPTDASPTGEFGLDSQSVSITQQQLTARFSLPMPVNLDQPISFANLQFVLVDVAFNIDTRTL